MFFTRRARPRGRATSRFTRPLVTANASLQAVADTILQPALLLAAIAIVLDGSLRQMATFAVASVAAWSLTPLVMLLPTTFLRNTAPITLAALILRLGAMAVLGLTALRLDDWTTDRVLGYLIGSYVAHQIGSAVMVQSNLQQSAVAPSARGVGRGLWWRNVAILIAAMLAAWAVWRQFSNQVPLQEALENLLLLSAVAVGSASLLRFVLIQSRTPTRAPSTLRLGAALRQAISSSAVRRFLAYRVLLALVAAFDPFLLWYGFDQLGLQIKYVGMALVAWTVGQVVGQLVWPWLSARIGSRIPLQIGITLRLFMLVLVVSIPEFIASKAYADQFDGPEAAFRTFAWSFLLLGLAASAGNASNQRYLMDVSTSGTVVGLTTWVNALAGVFAFAPFAVAWALGEWSSDRVFWGGIGLAVVALLASGLLPNARVKVRSKPGTWRKRTVSQPA